MTPEATGKDIASYLSALKPGAPEPVTREAIHPISRRALGPSRSVEVYINQKAMDRKKASDFCKLIDSLIKRTSVNLCPSYNKPYTTPHTLLISITASRSCVGT